MNLTQLVAEMGGELLGSFDPVLAGVQVDSRRVEVGDLFVALPGTRADGAEFLADALMRGAAAVLTPRPLARGVAPVQWVHPDAARVAGLASHRLAGGPASSMFVAGVTGTNGKTTVSHMTAQLLQHAGRTPGVIGTTGHALADGVHPSTHTTPDAPTLCDLAARHQRAGGDCLVLEVSSHALVQERTAGLRFDAAAFTNLSHDHLDYHGDMQSYRDAKARLFASLGPHTSAVIHLDDPVGPFMASVARAQGAEVLTYGTRGRTDYRARGLTSVEEGIRFELSGPQLGTQDVVLPLFGRFNVENALAALALSLVAGTDPAQAVEGLRTLRPAPGRMELVHLPGAPPAPRVLVDYAHTPDALQRALEGLREEQRMTGGRLWVVFGCGGDRDAAKREVMGSTAASLADVVVVTSDNPRSESPAAIAAAVCEGAQRVEGGELRLELDRAAAIELAVTSAEPADTVLIAGKGHERVQVDASGSRPFDDRAEARLALRRRREGVLA